MKELLKNYFLEISNRISLIIFLCGLIFIFIAFAVAFILSITKIDYKLYKRLWFFAFSCGIILAQIAFLITVDESVTMFLFSLGLTIICGGIILTIPVKKNKTVEVTQKQSELIKFLDSKISSDYDRNDVLEEKKDKEKNDTVKLKVEEEKNTTDNKKIIDYSHIKNIISRLSYYGLSPSDKRLVSDLELSVSEAEKGDDRKELKQKINEGLGALLKIMAKYGA